MCSAVCGVCGDCLGQAGLAAKVAHCILSVRWRQIHWEDMLRSPALLGRRAGVCTPPLPSADSAPASAAAPQPWMSACPPWIASTTTTTCLHSCCPLARGAKASTSPAQTQSSCMVSAALVVCTGGGVQAACSCSPGCARLPLLTAACPLLLYRLPAAVDVDFNPQIDRQAEDRCHRLGQTRPVMVRALGERGGGRVRQTHLRLPVAVNWQPGGCLLSLWGKALSGAAISCPAA